MSIKSVVRAQVKTDLGQETGLGNTGGLGVLRGLVGLYRVLELKSDIKLRLGQPC